MVKFICQGCKNQISLAKELTICSSCGWKPLIISGKPSWIEHNSDTPKHSDDQLGSLKSWLKRAPKLYSFLIAAISAVYPFAGRRELRELLRANSNNNVLNVGSGANRLSGRVVNVDITPFSEVDAIVDAESLPIPDNSIDMVISIAVLEHVRNPELVIAEMVRTLKVGGCAFVSVPFMQGFHASPHDYQRYTLPGLENLCKPLTVVKRITIGPTSSVVWIIAEWLATAFCLGSSRLQMILSVVFTTLLSPLKFADAVMRFLPGAVNISTAFALVLVKPQESA